MNDNAAGGDQKAKPLLTKTIVSMENTYQSLFLNLIGDYYLMSYICSTTYLMKIILHTF